MTGYRLRLKLLAALATCAVSALAAPAEATSPFALAPAAGPSVIESTDRIILRLRDSEALARLSPSARLQPLSTERARLLSMSAGTVLTPVRVLGSGAQVVRLTHDLPLDMVEAIVERLKRDPDVLHAEADRRKLPMQVVPNDPFFLPSGNNALGQWNLRDPLAGFGAAGINAEAAWVVTRGSPGMVIAVLDTGILANARDLIDPVSRLVTGYDFVSGDGPGDFRTANDGDGRDPNPSDPGNWVTAAEAGQFPFASCPTAQPSDWHGTHTTGIIAANANNGHGIAGINWNARILPVRVLGKCGGYTSDILDGMRWAAGLGVPNVPANAAPAQIINMSLGGAGPCSREEQATIDAVLVAGVRAIVTAAGNDGGTSTNTAPGNCTGVITVTAVDRSGSRASYSNVGPNVAVAAPGGFFSNTPPVVPPENGILSLFNCGTTAPVPDASCPSGTLPFAWIIGTSEAAAHVAGVASLMLAVNSNLTPSQIHAILRSSARVFPDATCTTSTCGAGLLDALRAVQGSSTPPADQGIGFGGVPGGGPPPITSGGGGGGGGGCTMGTGHHPDWLLALLALMACAGLVSRRVTRRRH